MAYEQIREVPEVLYHFTKKDNLESILRDGKINRFTDRECWFCTSLVDLHRYMELTVMNEGQAYYDTKGRVQRYPAFVADDYIILELQPRYQSGEWVKWNQEFPPDTPPEQQKLLKEFSTLKIGYRGDMKFKSCPNIIEVSEWLQELENPQQHYGHQMG